MREMVFIDGERLTQIDSSETQQPGDGSFKVGADGTVTIAPLNGASSSLEVEVAVRDYVWKQNSIHNISVEGIALQHASSKWEDGRAAMVVAGSNNVELVGLTVRSNNGEGTCRPSRARRTHQF